jgi:hypothetical protein
MAIGGGINSCLGLAVGLGTLLAALSFDLPRPLKFSTFLVSIGSLSYSVFCSYDWEQEAVFQSKLRTMDRELEDHELATRTNYLMELVTHQYLLPAPVPASGPAHQPPGLPHQPVVLSLPAHNPLNTVQRSCGEAGLAFLEYLSGRGAKHAGNGGWFNVSKLRRYWADHRGYTPESFTAFLQQLTQAGAGQFKDGDRREWKPTITLG